MNNSMNVTKITLWKKNKISNRRTH